MNGSNQERARVDVREDIIELLEAKVSDLSFKETITLADEGMKNSRLTDAIAKTLDQAPELQDDEPAFETLMNEYNEIVNPIIDDLLKRRERPSIEMHQAANPPAV